MYLLDEVETDTDHYLYGKHIDIKPSRYIFIKNN